MRFKTFLLRLFKSSFFWLAVLAVAFFSITMSSLEHNLRGDSGKYPFIRATSAHFDVTVNKNGDATITDTRTFNSSGVADFHVHEGELENNEVSIQCEGEEKQTYQAAQWSTLSSESEESIVDEEIDKLVSNSGQRVVQGDSFRLFVYFPEQRECTVSFTYFSGYSAKVYTDSAVANLDAMYDSDGPVTAVFHLPMPEGENLADVVKVEMLVKDSAPFVTAYDNIVSIEADYDFDVSVFFPRQWLNDLALSYDEPSSERFAMYSMQRVPLSDPNDETRGEAKDPRFVWKHLSLSDVGILWFILSIVVIGGGIAFVYIWKRKKKDDIFSGKYWRDVPDKELDPVVVGRLWAQNSELQVKKDVLIAVMSLINKRAVKLVEHGGDYMLKPLREDCDEELTAVDEATLDALFTHKYKEKVTLSELENRKNKIAEKIGGVVDKQVDDVESMIRFPKISFLAGAVFLLAFFAVVGNFMGAMYLKALIIWTCIALVSMLFLFPEVSFAKNSMKIRWSLWALSIAFFAVSIKLAHDYFDGLHFNNFWPVVILSVWGIVYFLLGFYVTWRSRRVESIVAKAEGLKNWLEDFTLLDEKPPSDVKVWGEFMVYATVFGVADKVEKELDGLEISAFNSKTFRSLASFAKEKIAAGD